MLPLTYTPDTRSPPGETILELALSLGYSERQFERLLDQQLRRTMELRPGHARLVLRSIVPVMPAVAAALELLLKVPAEFWIRRDSAYQSWLEAPVQALD